MWKNFINILEKRNCDNNHQDYCIWFANIFFYKIYSLEECIAILEKNNGQLLPISHNLVHHFYSQNVEFMINFLYHLNDLHNLDFIIMDDSKNTNIIKLFSESNTSLYFFNLFAYDNEILLSKNNIESTLLFLFFYFSPTNYHNNMLFHSQKNIPLISCANITFYHFEMLLYLMKSGHNYNSHTYNLNLLLIEDFCRYANDIYTFLDHNQWYEILPIDKILVLFKENFYFNTTAMQKNKNFSIVPTLFPFLDYLEKEYHYLSLKEKLISRDQFYQKNKIIKL